MRLIDLRDTGRERACIDRELHPLPHRLNGRVGYRLAKTEVVDDDVHRPTLPRGSATCQRVIPVRRPMQGYPRQQAVRGGRSSGTSGEVDELGGESAKRSRSARFEAIPSEARIAPPEGRPIALHVVVERHALAELAADERLARDRERDLAGARVAEAAGAQRDVVPAGDAVDVALVDDAAVGMQEVERDRRAAPLPRARSVDRRGRRAVAVPQRVERLEQQRAERGDAVVDRLDADAVEESQADLDRRAG